MTDYISREAAVRQWCGLHCGCEPDECGHTLEQDGTEHCTVVDFLLELPAADVRPVVRCGECKHCVEHYDTDGNAPYWVCKEWDGGTDYDGYCHYGERKDGDGDV